MLTIIAWNFFSFPSSHCENIVTHSTWNDQSSWLNYGFTRLKAPYRVLLPTVDTTHLTNSQSICCCHLKKSSGSTDRRTHYFIYTDKWRIDLSKRAEEIKVAVGHNKTQTQEPWIIWPDHLPASYQHLGSVRLTPLRPCHHTFKLKGVIIFTT